MLTTTQAAAQLGVTTCRVRALIQSGRLDATITPRGYAIEARALSSVRHRPNGRPGKAKAKRTAR